MGNFKATKKARLETQTVIADDATPAVVGQNEILPGVRMVKVAGVTNDANDWITLPDLAYVPEGFEIVILCAAGANFEMRTPASSNQKINNQDGDGTKEYLCTDTDVIHVVKMAGSAGWMAYEHTLLGAVVTAVVPD